MYKGMFQGLMNLENRKRNLSAIISPETEHRRVRQPTITQQQGILPGSYIYDPLEKGSASIIMASNTKVQVLAAEKQAIFEEMDRPDCKNKHRLYDRINLINQELNNV